MWYFEETVRRALSRFARYIRIGSCCKIFEDHSSSMSRWKSTVNKVHPQIPCEIESTKAASCGATILLMIARDVLTPIPYRNIRLDLCQSSMHQASRCISKANSLDRCCWKARKPSYNLTHNIVGWSFCFTTTSVNDSKSERLW